jgi:hypothetical protein
MLSVLATYVIDSKVVNNQKECDVRMGEKAGSVLGGGISEFSKMIREPFIGDDDGFGKAVHTFADFDEDITVVDEIMEFVLLHLKLL